MVRPARWCAGLCPFAIQTVSAHDNSHVMTLLSAADQAFIERHRLLPLRGATTSAQYPADKPCVGNALLRRAKNLGTRRSGKQRRCSIARWKRKTATGVPVR